MYSTSRARNLDDVHGFSWKMESSCSEERQLLVDTCSEERQLLVDTMGSNIINIEDVNLDEQVWSSLRDKAMEEDLTEFEKTGSLYQAGVDKQGRPVIVFIGKWFKPGTVEMEKALLYLIRVLEPISDSDYTVVFFCTRTGAENYISYWNIKDIYMKLPYHYKKNLKSFYIVHPSMWTRLTSWWFTTFMAPAIKQKIHNVYAVTELDAHIKSTQFDIPMFIQEYDMSLHGLRFYQP